MEQQKSGYFPENKEVKEIPLDENDKMSEEMINATSTMTIKTKKKKRYRNKNKKKNEQTNLTKQPLNRNQLDVWSKLDLVSGKTTNDLALTTYQPLSAENSLLIPPTEYNVLLMGQTGVGKSTFINALANYLKFEHFNTAKTSNLDVLIPCQFTVWNDKFQRQTIRFSSDVNETLGEDGQSSTQRCKEHLIVFENSLIRIFDTPGVGDTRGIDQDKLNLEDVLESLSKYENLHCICILLKPNESRLTATFEFCIKQLLCHLQKNAINNIVFIFTNSRSTFYKPGDTVIPLMTILDKIRTTSPFVDIPFNENNVFCLDNESFRFLLSFKQGIGFSSKQEEEFSQSWMTSVEECKRLMHYATNEKSGPVPHKIKETLCVNQARRVLVDLSRPLAELAQNIQDNLAVLKQHMEDIENCRDNVTELKKKLYLPQVTLEIDELNQPRTVCQASNCAKPYKVGTLIKCHYPQKCHDPCYLRDVPREIVGHEKLRHCAAMNKETACCEICHCPYKLHLHIYYESRPTNIQIVDKDIKEKIKNKTSVLEAAKIQAQKLQYQASMYKDEENKLTRYTAKLAIFLKQNAIVAYNDAFKEYLNQLIENEKTLSVKHGSNNQLVIKGLEDMVNNYLKEQEILEKTLNQHNNPEMIQPETVFDIVAELQQMQLTGGTLQLTMKACVNVSRRENESAASNYLMKAINWGIDKFTGGKKLLALPST